MPTLPTIEFPTIDLSKIELPFKLPFDLPTIDLPTIDLSKVELPNVDLPTADQVIDFFKDAALAGTGLLALTAEKIAELQKHRVEAVSEAVCKGRATV